MSSSDVLDRPAGTRRARRRSAWRPRIADPDRVADADLRALIANALRLYAVKAENGMRKPLPPDAGGAHRHRRHGRGDRSPPCAERAVVRAQHVAGDDRQLHRSAPTR